MTIVEALKNLVLAFGGTASNGETVVEVLKDVNETIGGTDSGGDTISEVLADVSDAVEDNVVVPDGKITITANATGIDVKQYAEADVNVPNPSTGKITITENGTDIDVSTYATADVAVSGGSSDFFIATVEDDTLDKTWQEVSDALDTLGDGKVWIISDYTAERVKACNPGELLHESWTIDVYDATGQTIGGEFYTEDGPNAYPVAD